MEEIIQSVFIEQYEHKTSWWDFSVKGDIIIRTRNKADYHFNNGHFEKLTFENVLVGSLKFSECNFEQLTLIGIDINDLIFTNSSAQRIELIKCRRGNLIINSGSKIGSIEISGLLTNLSFKDSSFADLKIFDSKNLQKIELVNSPNSAVEDKPKLAITSVNSTELLLDQYSAEEININNSNLQSFRIQNCEIVNIPIHKTNISFVNMSKSKIINLNSQKSNITNLSTNQTEFSTIQIHESEIVEYNIKGPIDSPVPNVNTIDLDGSIISLNGVLKISDIQIDNLIISHLRAVSGSVQISNSKINKVFSFEYSQLGESSFNSLNLRDCQVIKTLNSSFTSCKFFNIQWPSDYRIYEYQKEINETKNIETKITKYYNPLRESYRQLVSVSNRELNKIDSLFFQKQELRIYFEIIKFHKWKSWGNFQDFLVLGSNKLFSDFGQNIWKPLAWWLPIHGLLFSLILVKFDLGIKFVNYKEHSWEVFWKGAGIYLNFLNPVHGALVENTIDGKLVSIYGITDFAMRIISGYFLYYFISATRKFHLK